MNLNRVPLLARDPWDLALPQSLGKGAEPTMVLRVDDVPRPALAT